MNDRTQPNFSTRAVWPFISLAVVLLGLFGCSWVSGLPPDVPVDPVVTALTTPSATPAGEAAAPPTQAAAPPAQAITSPTPVVSATLPPTPVPVLRQLTSGGCCVQPFWSPDSSRVLFVDKPSPEAVAGLWSVGLEGVPPELYSERLGIYSSDLQFLAYPENGQTIVERLSDGQRWTIPNDGRAVSFSPDSAQIAWTAGQSGPPFDRALREVWISPVDGSQPRLAASLYSAGFGGWLPDGRLLVSGRQDTETSDQAYFIWSPVDGSMIEIARGPRLRSSTLSPDGAWLVYLATFSEDASQNGLWAANTLTGEKRQLGLFGAYRWRDAARLLIVPLDSESAVHRLWEIDLATGLSYPITDPAVTPFKIANGDWSVSPDGRKVVFVSAADHNLWLLEIP